MHLGIFGTLILVWIVWDLLKSAENRAVYRAKEEMRRELERKGRA
jgi:hypothetical protein